MFRRTDRPTSVLLYFGLFWTFRVFKNRGSVMLTLVILYSTDAKDYVPNSTLQNLFINISCCDWALFPNTPQDTLSSPYMHSKKELKLGNTEWTLAESDAFCNLLPSFLALSFMSAYDFMYQRLQRLSPTRISYSICQNLVCPYCKD